MKVLSLCVVLVTGCAALPRPGRPHLPLLPPGLSHLLQPEPDTESALNFQQSPLHYSLAARYPAQALRTPVSHFPEDERYAPHHNGSFDMRYWFDARYSEPTGPVYIVLGGETSGADRLPFLETGILPILAEPTGGLSIVLEHRFYGESIVTKDLSTDSLRFLDTAQSLADVAYFIQHVDIAGVGSIAHRPVVVYGGSYAGAQAAFMRKLYPDMVFAALASSAVTQAIVDYSAYWEPIRENAPPDCVATVIDTVQIVDDLLGVGDVKVTAEVKRAFGLSGITDDRDFVNLLTLPLGYFQAQNWDAEVSSDLFPGFCTQLARADVHEADMVAWSSLASGSRTTGVLGVARYAGFMRDIADAICPDIAQQDDCFGSFNATALEQDDLAQTWRLWQYQVCSEWGYYQGNAATSLPSLVSRFLDLDYSSHTCRLAYPPGKHNRLPRWPEVERVNQYGGYDLTATRLLFIDGASDPWLYATPHSPLAPARRPVPVDRDPNFLLIPGGVHHWDENGRRDGIEPGAIREVHAREVAWVRNVLREWEAGVRGA